MNQIERVTEMQQALDEATAAVAGMKTALENFRVAQEKLRKLDSYYGSNQWYEDVNADKHNHLPETLKRDVLTQEAVWDLVTENRELAIELLETGTEIIKNR